MLYKLLEFVKLCGYGLRDAAGGSRGMRDPLIAFLAQQVWVDRPAGSEAGPSRESYECVQY